MPIVQEDQIKDIKAQLEAQFSSKLSRSSNLDTKLDKTILYCKKSSVNHEKCPFLVEFIESSDGFIMKQSNLNHLKCCGSDSEETFFIKNRLMLESLKDDIIEIMRENPKFTPKDILNTLIENLNLNPKFMFQGLQGDKHFQRRMKKKFDNMILELRNEIGIVASRHKSKDKLRKKRFNFKQQESEHLNYRNNTLTKSKSKSTKNTKNNQVQHLDLLILNDNNFSSNLIPPHFQLVNNQDWNMMKIHLINRGNEDMIEDTMKNDTGKLDEFIDLNSEINMLKEQDFRI